MGVMMMVCSGLLHNVLPTVGRDVDEGFLGHVGIKGGILWQQMM
jgi:hypothetical protein